MSGSIRLHPFLGINPRLTTCTRCGGDGQDLILAGERNWEETCPNYHCGAHIYGGLRSSERCPKCDHIGPGTNRRYYSEHEKLACGLCKACEDEIKAHKQIVADGGCYWRCTECKREGVIKAESGLSKAVRAAHKLPAPEPCGIEFTKCAEHEPGHAEPKEANA